MAGNPPMYPQNPSIWSRMILGPSRWVFGSLERGSFIRRAVSLALRLSAVLNLFGGIYLIIQALKFSFGLPTGEGTAGGLFFTLLLVLNIAAQIQVLLYRAESVASLGESPFTVIPILSILSRLLGEQFAITGLTIGVGGCAYILVTGGSPIQLVNMIAPFLPVSASGGTFIDGVIWLAWALLISFSALLVFYFIAESILLFADIARNVRSLVKAKGANV
jgi:hypothetical protein